MAKNFAGMTTTGPRCDYDALRDLFTGIEWDTETGLDYFGARYFSGTQGRFTSPDAPLIDQHPSDPQSWNLYSYARNNPLKFTDPNGHWCIFGRIGSTCSSGDKPDVTSTVSYPEEPITNPAFYAVAQGVNNAAPVVNGLGNTLVTGAEFATGVPIGLIADVGSSDSSSTANAGISGVVLVDPSGIRYTQDSISPAFKDGRPVGELIEGLANGSVNPANVEPIRTFVKDGVTYTLDNRRLLAAREAGVKVATRPATAEEIASEAWKFTTRTEGLSIKVRGVIQALGRIIR